jgi:hypothetical protein
MSSAVADLAYFVSRSLRLDKDLKDIEESIKSSLTALKSLIRSEFTTFVKSAVRNALYLWLIINIVSMSSTYATA